MPIKWEHSANLPLIAKTAQTSPVPQNNGQWAWQVFLIARPKLAMTVHFIIIP